MAAHYEQHSLTPNMPKRVRIPFVKHAKTCQDTIYQTCLSKELSSNMAVHHLKKYQKAHEQQPHMFKRVSRPSVSVLQPSITLPDSPANRQLSPKEEQDVIQLARRHSLARTAVSPAW